MAGQPPAFLELARLGQDPVHRGDRAQVLSTAEQGGVDLQRRLVDEPADRDTNCAVGTVMGGSSAAEICFVGPFAGRTG